MNLGTSSSLHQLQRSRLQAIVDGVEHQQIIGRLDELHEIEFLRAAIEQADVFRGMT